MADIKALQLRLETVKKEKAKIQQQEIEYKVEIRNLKETIKTDLEQLAELGHVVETDEDITNLHTQLETSIVTFLETAEAKLGIS